MSKAIQIEKKGETLIVIFCRPEIRSPLSLLVLDEIDEILDAQVGVAGTIVFTGMNDVFASGADLNEIATLDRESALDFARRGQKLMRLIEDHPSDTVAAINGFCFGGALDLALSCRSRIASPSATFCHPGVGLGIITGWGGTQRLPRQIGEGAALEMFLTAVPINAREALRIGLVDMLVDDPLAEALNR